MGLTNRDIMDNHSGDVFHVMMSSVQGAFAYYVTRQLDSDYINLNDSLNVFSNYLRVNYFKDRRNTVLQLSYDDIVEMISEDVFGSMPEIMSLNQIDGWIDLCALSRNIQFMVMREDIVNR